MSELQQDDPDPLPNQREYPVNFETNQAFDGASSEYWLEQEILSRDEREDIAKLSSYANDVIDMYGEGSGTNRHAYLNGAELHRVILEGAWLYTFIDDIDNRYRCRAWRLGGEGVSWCEDEWRYEEASSVHDRLRILFPLQERDNQPKAVRELVTRGTTRLKRAMAAAILR